MVFLPKVVKKFPYKNCNRGLRAAALANGTINAAQRILGFASFAAAAFTVFTLVTHVVLD